MTRKEIQQWTLEWHREQRELKARAVDLMQEGLCGTFEKTAEGQRDTTVETITSSMAEIERHDEFIALYERDLAQAG